MNFRYTALGTNNQKLEGVLEAGTIDDARAQLHKMGLSVVAIKEVIPEPEISPEDKGAPKIKVINDIITYYFLARDSQGKEINGTIDAKEPYSAYRRLFTEYQFEVLDLYPENSSDKIADSLKSQFEKWKEMMEGEGIDLSKKTSFGLKDELEEENKKMNEVIEAEIDSFIVNTKNILNSNRPHYSESFLREIEKTLNELERIRTSNNLKHITKICNDLYELVSNPDVIVTDNNNELPKDDGAALEKLKESGFLTNRFRFLESRQLKKKANNFGAIKKLFSKVNHVLDSKKMSDMDSGVTKKVSDSFTSAKRSASPDLMLVIGKFFSYFATSNTILRRARKQEMMKVYQEWRSHKEQLEKNRDELQKKIPVTPSPEIQKPERVMRDFSGFFMELNSFVGWLLFFYISYFFLISFSIEKNIGLPKELVMKTLASPLIINISVFLALAHLAFSLKLKLFRRNFLGSLFLFFLISSLYTIVMVNF